MIPDAYTHVIVDKGTVVLNSSVVVKSFTLGDGASCTITGTNTLTLTR